MNDGNYLEFLHWLNRYCEFVNGKILIHYVPSFLFLLLNYHRVCIIFEAGTTPQWREDPRSGRNHVQGSLTEGLSKHSDIATKAKVIDILSTTNVGSVYPSNGHVHNLLFPHRTTDIFNYLLEFLWDFDDHRPNQGHK